MPRDDLALAHRIEHASLNAWPALHHVLSDGWLARFCGGFTKRANSVAIVTAGTLPLGTHIDFCEGLYRQQGLRPMFRLTDIGVEPELDAALAARGYARIDPTLVMVAPALPTTEPIATLAKEPWLDHYTALSGSPEAARRLHALLLGAIQLPCAFGVVHAPGDGVVACGLAVREADLVGLFDIVTHAERRRAGHGERLTRGLVGWGAAGGARIAYLQVLEQNETARRLYTRLGFTLSHRYWYRVHPG